MSRRSSSKLGKDKGTYKVNETSLGAAFAAKDPQAAQKLVDEAAAANTRSPGTRRTASHAGRFHPCQKTKGNQIQTASQIIEETKEEKIKDSASQPKAQKWSLEDQAYCCASKVS